MHENDVLNAVASCHPVKSSYAKLVKVTGKARNDLTEIVTALKAVGFLNVTPSNEIYLLKDGLHYVGIDHANPASSSSLSPDIEPKAFTEDQTSKPERTVFSSIEQLAIKLSKPTVEVDNVDLKAQTLTKLAEILSDDIAELLLEIKGDIENVAT
jgi:hypothetical protein